MNSGILREVREKLDFAKSGKPMLIGMAAILAIVAVAAGCVLSGTATASNFTVEAKSEATESAESESHETTVFVHVSGAVCSPGLYEIEEGARVADAIQAAGGFSEDADSDSCNLARVLNDGEHIVIAKTGDGVLAGGDGAGSVSVGDSGSNGTLVNLNTATASQLESLPGIGASTAQKIIADRENNGPFKTVEELTRVSGIGEKKLAALIDFVCV